MKNVSEMTKSTQLDSYGIIDANVHWNLTPEKLQESTLSKGMGKETNNGTLAINTGKFTGRSPQDRFLVKDDYTRDKVWWGKVNKAISPANFDTLYDEVVNYMSGKELYARDGYVCADPQYKMNVRTVTEYPWSNMFIFNMFYARMQPNWKTLRKSGSCSAHLGMSLPIPRLWDCVKGISPY